MSDERLTRIENKLDTALEKINETNVHLAGYNVQLGEHMRRTEIAEKRIEDIEKNKIEPLQEHMLKQRGALKLLGILSAVIGIAVGILKIMRMI